MSHLFLPATVVLKAGAVKIESVQMYPSSMHSHLLLMQQPTASPMLPLVHLPPVVVPKLTGISFTSMKLALLLS